MKTVLNRVSMYPVYLGPVPTTKNRVGDIVLSRNNMSLVALRNKQIKENVDTVSFSGLVNR